MDRAGGHDRRRDRPDRLFGQARAQGRRRARGLTGRGTAASCHRRPAVRAGGPAEAASGLVRHRRAERVRDRPVAPKRARLRDPWAGRPAHAERARGGRRPRARAREEPRRDGHDDRQLRGDGRPADAQARAHQHPAVLLRDHDRSGDVGLRQAAAARAVPAPRVRCRPDRGPADRAAECVWPRRW